MPAWFVWPVALGICVISGLLWMEYRSRQRIKQKVDTIVNAITLNVCPACEIGLLVFNSQQMDPAKFTYRGTTVDVAMRYSTCNKCGEKVVEREHEEYNESLFDQARNKIDIMHSIGNSDVVPMTLPLGSHSPQYNFTIVEEGASILTGNTEPLYLRFYDSGTPDSERTGLLVDVECISIKNKNDSKVKLSVHAINGGEIKTSIEDLAGHIARNIMYIFARQKINLAGVAVHFKSSEG